MKKKKIVIAGAGVAGLSAGIYAALNGYEVELYDMHARPGGQCTAWQRKGFRFDYCLHWVVGTATGPFHDIWRETNAITEEVQIINHDISVSFVDEQGRPFDVYTNVDKWEAYLIEIAPEDTRAIRRMCSEMRKGFSLQPFRNAPGTRKWTEYLAAIKMWRMGPLWMKHAHETTHEYFTKLNLKNPRLRNVLEAAYGGDDFSAMVFLMMFSWFGQNNAGYPLGGSEPFTARMAQRFLALGGSFVPNKKVQRILVNDSIATGLAFDDGTQVEADYVISAADGHATLFDMLGGAYTTPQIRESYRDWTLFNPFVQVSFGLNTLIPETSVTRFFLARGKRIGCTTLQQGYSVMNYGFDPTMAPDGSSVIIVRFDSAWEQWEKMDADTYHNEKANILDEVSALLEQHYPGITKNIVVTDVATPRTGVRYTGVWKGAYEGFLPSAKNLGSSLPMTLPGLNNFYMIGQWLYPGGGVPPAAQSGKWAIQYICKNDRKTFLSK